MRVFLVHVRDPQFYAIPAKRRSRNGRVRVMGFPPIGIMALSAVLKRAGHEVVLFDQADPATPTAVIIEELRRQRPVLVGLSFLSTTSYPYAKLLARQLRAADARVKIAFGGVFASLNPEPVKRQVPEVDFVCRGDGEQLLLDLLERLDDPGTVPGVTWQEPDGRIRQNPSRPLERDLDQWPFPDREGLAFDFVESMPLDVPAVLSIARFTTMQTSRGCPWPCVFCDIPIFNEGKWRSRSPEHVLAEMSHLEEHGYGSVYFVDDHFLLQPKRIAAICSGIVARGLSLEWGCEGRVDSVCLRLFPAMAQAHCRTLMFGIESGSQKVLDRLKKEQTLAGRAGGHGGEGRGNRDRARLLRRREPRRVGGGDARHVPLRRPAPTRQLRVQPAVRLSRHAALARVRAPRPRGRRGRLVQVLQVLVDRSDRAAG